MALADVQTNLWHEENRRNSLIHSRTDGRRGERVTNQGRNASERERKSERAPSAKPTLGAPRAASRGRRAFASVCRTVGRRTRSREREGERREPAADADEMREGPPPSLPRPSLFQPRATSTIRNFPAGGGEGTQRRPRRGGAAAIQQTDGRGRTVPDDRRPSTSSTFRVPTD